LSQPVGGPLQRRRRHRRIALIGLDAGMIVLAVAALLVGSSSGRFVAQPFGWIALYGLLCLTIIGARGGYRFRIETSPFEYLGQVFAGTAIAATTVLALRVLLAPDLDAAVQAVRLWLFSSGYLGAGRIALAIADRRPDRHGLPTLVVGAGEVGRTVARRLASRPQLGLTPVGFLDKQPRHDLEELSDPPVLGASWDLEDVVQRHAVEHVVVAFSNAPHAVLLDIVRRCRALGLDVSVVPRLYEEVSRRVSVEHVGGISLLRIERADPRGWQFESKYLLDRVIGALLLLVCAPLLAVLVLLVRLTSPGPVFFRQLRIGLDGREFEVLKLRTMRVDEQGREHDAAWASRMLGDVEAETLEAEDRRTPLGSVLRRFCLDELPQLVNIAKGDMSFIGPRPERTGYVRAFEHHVYRYGDRHRVKSGLTGWAQVNGLRGETSLAERVEWDNYYVENWSPWLDLKIVLLTIPAIIAGPFRP